MAEYHRIDADKTIVFHGAPVNNGIMPHRYTVANHCGGVVIRVDGAVVLDIGAFSHGYGGHIPP